MIARNQVGAGLMALFERLVSYQVDWAFSSRFNEENYEPGDDRAEAPLAQANVVSSYLREHFLKPRSTTIGDDDFLDFSSDLLDEPRHIVALDLDIPAHLVPSHTEGHSHLYIDVPGGVAHSDYMELLELLGRIGVIEPGYAEVSRKRGHTDLRLPWVAKEPRLERPQSRCCRCLQEGPDIQEYVDQAAMEIGPMPLAEQVEDWIWKNEGTLNRQSGLFACTACYIAMGQPSSPRGWTPPGPDSIQPLESVPLPKQAPASPVQVPLDDTF